MASSEHGHFLPLATRDETRRVKPDSMLETGQHDCPSFELFACPIGGHRMRRSDNDHKKQGEIMRAILAILFAAALLTGCSTVPDQQYQTAGFRDKSCSLNGSGREATCPPDSSRGEEGQRIERKFSVAFLEYCELESAACKAPGQLFAPGQLLAIRQRIESANAAGQATLVAVYVHGWHHNASTEDGNVKYFDHMLARYADALARAGRTDIRVLGIYVGWRGELIEASIPSVFTVADRGRAADRIAQGTVAADLATIAAAVQAGPASSRMLVTGHSFGGRLVSRALLPKFRENYQPLGDKALIVTLNAAIGADAYYDLYQDPARLSPSAGKPTWVNITSLDDWATKWTYPIARYVGNLQPDHPEDDSSGRTIGHFGPYKTHQLGFANCNAVGCGDPATLSGLLNVDYWSPAPFHFFVLRYAVETGADTLDMCGLVREYPYNQKAVDAMERPGVCKDLVGSESPFTGRKRYPANGHLWNIEADKSVIDTDGLQPTSTAVHNATTQTNLATMLVRLLYAER
ncbi:hypothetical protein [Cupriavidus sp. USMAA2-4]|uniref:hypothetical protein n=1 Tax=Cupriavidus sp. USMAA2-4 TaxID=876364 RepID=UPI000A8BF2D6|nr:hypothetical protein [Cupriavidus sp. USMAA2-4]